jgi:hypothetical protein
MLPVRRAFRCAYPLLLPYFLPTKNAQRHAVLSWYMYSGAPPSCNSCYVCTFMRIPIVVRQIKLDIAAIYRDSFLHLIQKHRSQLGFVIYLLNCPRINVTKDQHYASILTGFFVRDSSYCMQFKGLLPSSHTWGKKVRINKLLFHFIYLDKILYNLKKMITCYTDVRTVAVSHKYMFLFICCDVLLQHVSARTQGGIIVLPKYQEKCICKLPQFYTVHVEISNLQKL